MKESANQEKRQKKMKTASPYVQRKNGYQLKLLEN